MLEEEFGTRPELIEGSGGVFDVRADGTLVFSRDEAQRFPEPAEVVDLLKAR